MGTRMGTWMELAAALAVVGERVHSRGGGERDRPSGELTEAGTGSNVSKESGEERVDLGNLVFVPGKNSEPILRGKGSVVSSHHHIGTKEEDSLVTSDVMGADDPVEPNRGQNSRVECFDSSPRIAV